MIQNLPSGDKLTGFYRGLVIEHLTHGYCRIWIPGIHPEDYKLLAYMLPPAEQASSLFGGTTNGSGIFTYPNIGSIVWCFFANGDQNYPVYFASSLGGENAFGQHEIIKTQDEVKSEKHLITSGKTHIEWYENGKLSVQVEDPDRRDSKVKYNDFYPYKIADDVVSSRPICEKVDSEELSNVHCKIVMDNVENGGEIFLNTHRYVNNNTWINTYEKKNATDNIIVGTDCKSPTKEATSQININSTDNSGLHEESYDYTERCKLIVDKTAKNGKIEIKICDLDNESGSFSRLYLDKKGNIYIESSQSIILKSKVISMESENQFDMKANSMKITTVTDASIVSPALNIDTSTGHTIIKSITGEKSF